MDRAGVILDMDGLLVNTEPFQFGAFDRLLRERRGVSLPHELVVSLIGHPIWESAARLRELYGLRESVDELVAAQAAYYEPLLREEAEIMPGAEDLVHEMHARGWAMAIASSSPLKQVRIVSERLGLNGILSAVASGEEVQNGKPAPDVYLLAAERLGIPPARCVALEDSETGTMAAKRAGMHVIAVPNADTMTHSFAHADIVRSSLVGAAADIVSLLNGGTDRPARQDGGAL